MRVQIVSSYSREWEGRTYFVAEGNTMLEGVIRNVKFNLPKEHRAPVTPGAYDLTITPYADGKGKLAFGVSKLVAATAAVKAA